MHAALSELFSFYPKEQAPFLHGKLADWSQSKPLKGLRVVNHVPLFRNTVTKIACLVEVGANVTATNPNSHQFDQEMTSQWFIASPKETESLCVS